MATNTRQHKYVNNQANGNSDSFNWGGGDGVAYVQGTWNGATAKIQISPDGSTWHDLGTDATFTADGVVGFSLAVGTYMRLNVASGGGSESIDLIIGQVHSINQLG